MYTYSLYIISFTLTLILPISLSNCPPDEALPDCTCTANELNSAEIRLHCKDITNADVFKKQVQLLNSNVSATVRLDNFDFPHFSDGTFIGTNIKALYLIEGKLKTISKVPRFYAFNGLENTVKIFYAYEILGMESWDWDQFSVLKSLVFLLVQECPAEESERSSALFGLPLMRIVVRNSNMKEIGYRTFADMNNLTVLDLSHNSIWELEREQLPSSAPYLTFINLRNNHLESLRYDTFQDLPALSYLDLSSNHLSTLPELLFSPVWNHLHIVFISGNPLLCDSRVAWLLRSNSQDDKVTDISRITCHSPPRLAGKVLRDLYESDLQVDNDVD